MMAFLASQLFRVHCSQELKLRYVSGGIQQQVGISQAPVHQPLPGPAGITLEARGHSVLFELSSILVHSPGSRCCLICAGSPSSSVNGSHTVMA